MTVVELRRLIAEHRAELEAIATVRPAPIESFAKYEVVRQRLVGYLRELCLALGRETVLPLQNWSVRWTQRDTDVRFLSRQWWTAWLAFESLGQKGQRRAFLCEFKSVCATRFTSVDYDHLDQHPLSKAGLEGLGAYCVENSKWIARLRKEDDRPELEHFLFCFNSCLVECAAESVEIVGESDSVPHVWRSVPTD
jgi:hypothetical protein